ncbi:MAG: thioredoxin [Thermogemmatispora sp.]|uniref:thioredoxin n=1 Tax=Thermogemmatispora sp. TaxID=1968838 RepID=UPI001D22CD03|nr:thioredoxin [Thermogemmatispora sp.]MBX5449198.1 thioredoxin [Thermogemmatispora sp.]
MAERSNLFHVSDGDFEARVLKSPTPVIVDFWATWCPPCRALAPTYEQLSDEYKGKLAFAKMDIDENPSTPVRLNIQAVPTLIVFKDGREIARLVGPHPLRLKSEIDRILAQARVA